MIDDVIKKDKAIAITSYCDTEEKVNVLIQNINLIRTRFPDCRIVLHANYPLAENIQKMVDDYLYQDLNYVPEDKWIYYWNIVTDVKTEQSYFNKKFYYSIIDTAFSVFQQIKALAKHVIEYKWAMLINYDTSVEEIRIEDYSTDYDLVLHYFPGHKAVSLIMMSFNPQVFYNKVARNFTYENWMRPQRINQLNEERFFDIINESDIHYFAYDYKVSDKVSNEPDYHNRHNAPPNDFFGSYLLYHKEGVLEIYLWELLTEIKSIVVRDEDQQSYNLKNQNKMGAFEYMLPHDKNIKAIEIQKINNIKTNIMLKIKKGYSTRNL
jgi:hypothetical protein